MSSRNKEAILQRHLENGLLTTAVPAITVGGTRNIAADESITPLDERIIASTLEALDAGQTHYVDVPGVAPLREAVASYLNDVNSAAYKTTNILVTAGMQEARFLTLQMIGAQFSSIVLPSIVHPGARKALGVRALNIDPIDVDAAGNLLPSLSNIRRVLEGGSRLLYLESPSRLSGAAYTATEVEQIANMLREHNASAIWDSGLSGWAANGSIASLASHANSSLQIAVIGEAFPGSGLSSWLVGYIAAPEEWVAIMQSQKQIMAICTSTPSQYGALEASKLYAQTQPERFTQMTHLRAALVEQLRGLGWQPVEGNVASTLALRMSAEEKEKVSGALRSAGFMFADGADFGAPGILRFTVSTGTVEALQLLTGEK